MQAAIISRVSGHACGLSSRIRGSERPQSAPWIARVATTAGKRSDELVYSFNEKPSTPQVAEVDLVPGLQEFAATAWEARRHMMPTHADPLDFLFAEFDEDGDGSLTAVEISNALGSKGVQVSPQQVQKFVDATDANKNGMVERAEFADFIFHMAVADLKHMDEEDA